MGQRLAAGFAEGIRESGLPAQVTGLAPAPAVRFQTGDASQDNEMRLIFHREMFRRGIFAAEPWILSYAHSPADVDHTVEAAWEALRVVGQLLG
jgi:glutamate-1-semialdehyde aminotransferase